MNIINDINRIDTLEKFFLDHLQQKNDNNLKQNDNEHNQRHQQN
nr:MAG TPA: hypothetical protein [Caudoviricetes sp.]